MAYNSRQDAGFTTCLGGHLHVRRIETSRTRSGLPCTLPSGYRIATSSTELRYSFRATRARSRTAAPAPSSASGRRLRERRGRFGVVEHLGGAELLLVRRQRVAAILRRSHASTLSAVGPCTPSAPSSRTRRPPAPWRILSGSIGAVPEHLCAPRSDRESRRESATN